MGTCIRSPTAFTMSKGPRRQPDTIARQPSMATIAIAGSALEGTTSGKKPHAQGQPVLISMAKFLKICLMKNMKKNHEDLFPQETALPHWLKFGTFHVLFDKIQSHGGKLHQFS